MGLQMLLEGASQGGEGVWSVKVPSHQIPMLGVPKMISGARSVLLAKGVRFEPLSAAIQIDVDSVSVLNQGTTAETLVIEAAGPQVSRTGVVASKNLNKSPVDRGPGDTEFLQLVERELRGEAREAAEAILREVRSRYPGDLERGLRLNFKNTPDNFWYIIVQPRVQGLSITVRGVPSRFLPSTLDLKVDRPGYTRFSLRRPEEVPEALRIIERSKRR